jgi:hypothetical protein
VWSAWERPLVSRCKVGFGRRGAHHLLRAKDGAGELRETRTAAEREPEALKNHEERSEQLKQVRDILLKSLAEVVPARLETLSGLERNEAYRILRPLVTPGPEGYEVTGAFCTIEPCGS